MSRFLAPAKVNLALHVTGRRADGYHLIETLAVFTRFGDRIMVTSSNRDAFQASGPFGTKIPAGADNLVLKARDHFRRLHGRGDDEPLSIQLEKNLPPASGLGGGSSDAAATLRALRARTRPSPPLGTLIDEALSLGADMPMCLAARPLVARGIGERIEILERFPSLALVLVNPGVEVSTPAVFRAIESADNGGFTSPPPSDPALLRAWLGETRNDLQTAACGIAPVIVETLRALNENGAHLARMSGSGATCFGLFADENHAKDAARSLRRDHPGWFVAATRSMASSEELDDDG